MSEKDKQKKSHPLFSSYWIHHRGIYSVCTVQVSVPNLCLHQHHFFMPGSGQGRSAE